MSSKLLRRLPVAAVTVAALVALGGCAASPGGIGPGSGAGDSAASQTSSGGYQAITGQSAIAKRSFDAAQGVSTPSKP